MKKINRTLSFVLAATILFSVLISVSNVAAQNGDLQGDGDEEGNQLRTRLRDCDGEPIKDWDRERLQICDGDGNGDCDGEGDKDHLRIRLRDCDEDPIIPT